MFENRARFWFGLGFAAALVSCTKPTTTNTQVKAVMDQPTLVKSLVEKLQDPGSDLFTKGAQYQDELQALMAAHPEIQAKTRESYLSLLQSLSSMSGQDIVSSAVRGARARRATRGLVGPVCVPVAPPAPVPAPAPAAGVCPVSSFCAWAVGFASAQAYAYAYAYACKSCASGETICVEAEAEAYAYAYAYAFAYACASAGGGAPAAAAVATTSCNPMDDLIADVPMVTPTPTPTSGI
jgi:hypothetical protein